MEYNVLEQLFNVLEGLNIAAENYIKDDNTEGQNKLYRQWLQKRNCAVTVLVERVKKEGWDNFDVILEEYRKGRT